MGFFLPQDPVRGSLVDTLRKYSNWSIRTKLILTIIPLVGAVIMLAGLATRMVAGKYLSMALERTTMVLTMGQAHAVSQLLEQGRQDLLLLAKADPTEDHVQTFLTTQSHIQPGVYREVAFVGAKGDNHILCINTGRDIVRVRPDQTDRIKETPLLLPARVADAKPGDVSLFGLTETTYPLGVLPGNGSGLTLPVFRLITPTHDKAGNLSGFWVLSIDGRSLRDILSLYNSVKSPLAAFLRAPEKRYSFFFDKYGWLLFQSASVEDKSKPLSTDLARSGLSGDHGMPAYAGAFRPSTSNEAFWRMVSEVQGGKNGLEIVDQDLELLPNGRDAYTLGYAPVYFQSSLERTPDVVGGVAFMDRSRLLMTAEYRIYDMLLAIFLGSVLLSGVVIWLVSRSITKPILALVGALRAMPKSEGPKLLTLNVRDKESKLLKDSINLLLATLTSHEEQLREKDASLQRHIRREPVDLEGKRSPVQDDLPIDGIIGVSQHMRELKWLIRKAALVDPDVLIIGETGTGKEVTANAVHRLSRRGKGPFISINCGALDENLLLDALFGHVKGAFSDAKTDRKGAFLAAEGGTILLDEIGNASAKVQQALLRTLATRTVIPLGSDQEMPFNVRVIAATNVDLLECVEQGTFREDLYYRLRVLTLHTPPLRERKEDIPLLADAFLKESASIMKKEPVTLSRGAWERISAHDWPGNVRELKHCLMRAVAMSETDVIYLEDLRFDSQLTTRDFAPAPALSEPNKPGAAGTPRRGVDAAAEAMQNLNERQRKGLAYVREHGVMSRAQYQNILGENVPPRTAQYDLRDLVERGLLVIRGKGPATKYSMAENVAKAS